MKNLKNYEIFEKKIINFYLNGKNYEMFFF